MPRSPRAWRRAVLVGLILLPSYAAVAYVVAPAAWARYERRRLVRGAAGITYTAERIPADPLNVALVGKRAELARAMEEAGWVETDRICLRSGLRVAGSIMFHRPYARAPVSTHYLWERPQDLAFERIVDGSPRRRHHVRFWRARGPAGAGEVWIGAASYDRTLGFSRYTGELMHHIDAEVDEERRTLFEDLTRAFRLARIERVPEFRPAGAGVNGGGDAYRTDGALWIGYLSPVELSRPAASRSR
jgi:hypothetical protein